MTKLEALAVAYRMALKQEQDLKQAADFLTKQAAVAKVQHDEAANLATTARAALAEFVEAAEPDFAASEGRHEFMAEVERKLTQAWVAHTIAKPNHQGE